MRSVFERLIVEFHAASRPEPVPREVRFPELPANVRKAHVLIGMRRTGKTWALYGRMQELLRRGLDRTKILYINFEDDRLFPLSAPDLQGLLDAYFSLYPRHAGADDLHFFFDEVHEAPGWEKFIRRLLDRENARIYATGSSAKMLGREIATALRGRTLVKEVFPYSFREYLASQDAPFQPPFTDKAAAALVHHCRRYLRIGGFPEAVSLPEPLHRALLQGYMDTVIHRDIEERHDIGHPLLLKDLLRHCLQNVSSPMSLHKLYQRFKSLGRAVSKDSLYAFMGHFLDAYCLFPVPVYSHSLQQRNVLPKKIYCADPGLITAYTVKPETEEAARLENAVFCALRRRTDEIFYFKTKTGKEVDFLAVLPDGTKSLIQACVSLDRDDIRERETSAMWEALSETGLKEGTIVTGVEEELLRQDGRVIRCIPAWKWLLTP